jgi:hypothetical protein
MAEQRPLLRVFGLSNADRLELPVFVGEANCDFPPPDGSGESLGEPFTVMALVVLSAVAIKGLVAFLAEKSLERQETVTEVSLELEEANGQKITKRIKVTDRGQGMAPELAKELGDMTGLPWKQLLP